ncbi:glycoside hydrolase family 2 [bacterium]|nr:MAG: glycoside hydrolase family 2 [bacterium]
MTKWGRKVTAENAWRSYPRPQMAREQWQNLNGSWDYALTKISAPRPSRMNAKILVPFAVESRLSGVGRKVLPDDRIWYRRNFTIPANWAGQRIKLHFGAVDYEAVVQVNGSYVGGHKGGSDAFAFDITDYLKPGNNELLVQVTDPTTSGSQPRGKQTLEPRRIWYTPVSGIWQTVWLEPVPTLSIAEVRATPDIDKGTLAVDVALSGPTAATDAVRLTARSQGQVVATTILRGNRRTVLSIPNARLWSPNDPFLYDLTAELVKVENPFADRPNPNQAQSNARLTNAEEGIYAKAKVVGTAVDKVETYFAMRKISVGPGPKEGQPALLLNNKYLFQNGVLDQGWWPESLLTPPSEEAAVSDILFLKKAGFNMLRKHIKVEPAQYYHEADRLGMLIWQDMPSGGFPDHAVSGSSEREATASSEQMAQYQDEFTRIIGNLRAFPSIVMWVVNNEGWGQVESRTLSQLVRSKDPSRLVNATSGWLDAAPDVSSIYAIHTYDEVPRTPKAQKDRPIVIGEYGGVGLSVDGHLWFPERRQNIYQIAQTSADYETRYTRKFNEIVRMAKENGLSAAVYTETSDVEGEVNGFLTYDREVVKIPAEKLADLAAPLKEIKAP